MDIVPTTTGVAPIGHMGYFRPHAEPLWSEVLDWFESMPVTAVAVLQRCSSKPMPQITSFGNRARSSARELETHLNPRPVDADRKLTI